MIGSLEMTVLVTGCNVFAVQDLFFQNKKFAMSLDRISLI